MYCKYCGSECNKSGKQQDSTQKYKCRNCHKYQQKSYLYNACTNQAKQQFVNFELKLNF